MANASFLIESTFNLNPLLQHTFRVPPLRSFPIHNNPFKFNYSPHKSIKKSPTLTTKCFSMIPKPKLKNDISGNSVPEDNDSKAAVTINLSINEVIKNVLKVLQTGVLLALLFLSNHHNHGSIAMAASGGRMGGSNFSSSSRTTSSSSPSYSSSSSTSSYSSPSHSSYSYSISTPTLSPSSTDIEDGTASVVTIIILVVVYVVKQITDFFSYLGRQISNFLSFGSTPNDATTTTTNKDSSVVVKLQDYSYDATTTTKETSVVVKLQVGLLGMGKSLQTDLNRIAEVADTSTPQGLSYILQETILALLRHPDFWISGWIRRGVKRNVRKALIKFLLKRGVNLMKRLLSTSTTSESKVQQVKDQMASAMSILWLITIVVAASGVHKLPPINNSAQLKESLQKLASIPSSRILAVEVLWTPQRENDTLTERELLENYSLLRPL